MEIAKCKLQNANFQLKRKIAPHLKTRYFEHFAICILQFAFCNFLSLGVGNEYR
jgi:hypothetical protein